MVTVTNGAQTFVIPEGAVMVYKNMGFRPVGLSKPNKVKKPVNVDEPSETADDFEELLQRPISQWNQEEIKEFAAAKGYDVSGAKSLKQARAIIKDALDLEAKVLAEE